ncbi:transcription repressor OFP12-like [Panicum miliaceum]|uniref:Transcription repressor n=1 Tax=Panicum miliaceum TaxID=4540 RepID=A0A3L6TJS3_PANMI|nr:transcription repressor OFP12-like [Panicum miliaceum]
MPRGAERAMLGCFQVARRPSLSYEEGSTSAPSTSASPPTSSASTSSPAFLDDDDALYLDDAEPEPDAGGLSTAIAARRFFLASPGRSNSIFDSAEHPPAASLARDSASNVRALRRAATSAFPTSAAAAAASSSSSAAKAPFRDDDMQPVRKVSLSTDAPRADFLKSMVEMVEALGLDPRRRDADLARLHDLLLCYIALNERDALRDILGAFADLMCLLDGGKQDAAATATAAGGVDDGGEKRDARVQDRTARRG